MASGVLRNAFLLAVSATSLVAQDLYAEFKSAELLDSYRIDTIEEVLKDVVNSSWYWSQWAINGPPGEGQLTVLIVDPRRTPAAALSPFANLRLQRLRNGAAAEPRGDYVMLDGAELRAWAAASFLFAQDFESMNAAATTFAYNLDELRPLWDPSQNPALVENSEGVNAAEIFAGAVGFTLAHEIQHLRAAQASPSMQGMPPELDGRAAELSWACPELLHPRISELREAEAAADRGAVAIIAQLKTRTASYERLKYEFGTYWLGLHMLGRTMVGIGARTNDPFIRTVTLSNLDQQVAARLTDRFQRDREKGALVSQVFRKSHPADVDRLLEVAKQLRATPHSAYRDDTDSSVDTDTMIWNLLKSRICAEARAASP